MPCDATGWPGPIWRSSWPVAAPSRTRREWCLDMVTRRQFVLGSAALVGGAALIDPRRAPAQPGAPVVAEHVRHQFAPGLEADCWGYNGRTPGPTIEVTQGDRVRVYVTNRLPEPTSLHWHGVLLPNGMDG